MKGFLSYLIPTYRKYSHRVLPAVASIIFCAVVFAGVLAAGRMMRHVAVNTVADNNHGLSQLVSERFIVGSPYEKLTSDDIDTISVPPLADTLETTLDEESGDRITDEKISIKTITVLPQALPLQGPQKILAPDVVSKSPLSDETVAKKPSVQQQAGLKRWERNAEPMPEGAKNKPKIVLIIDDMGMSPARAHEVIALPGPIDLAFLPYSKNTAELAAQGHKAGHEILLHMPMEAMNGNMDLGPDMTSLTTKMSAAEITKHLNKAFASYDGYAGLNNHMGSRLTQDKPAMTAVMAFLKKKELFFLDSRTIAGSVGAETAKEQGVPYASRDVFLDHVPTLDFVRKSLKKTEDMARRNGVAIAIGHPKEYTIEGLKEWLPTLKDKGIALVPVSAVLHIAEAPVPDLIPPFTSPAPAPVKPVTVGANDRL